MENQRSSNDSIVDLRLNCIEILKRRIAIVESEDLERLLKFVDQHNRLLRLDCVNLACSGAQDGYAIIEKIMAQAETIYKLVTEPIDNKTEQVVKKEHLDLAIKFIESHAFVGMRICYAPYNKLGKLVGYKLANRLLRFIGSPGHLMLMFEKSGIIAILQMLRDGNFMEFFNHVGSHNIPDFLKPINLEDQGIL